MAQTLCWKCKNAVPGPEAGCPWSERFEPVEGWEAEFTQVRSQRNRARIEVESYCVIKCPLFEEG